MPDSISITLAAKGMEGRPAQDPTATVEVLEVAPLQRVVSRQVVHNFDGEVTLSVPAPEGVASWRVNVSFSRYDGVSGFFLLPRRGDSPRFEMEVTRLPRAWRPQFTELQTLSPVRFGDFSKIVGASSNVDLKAKGAPAVGNLQAKYDKLAHPAQIQAKMALLNLFTVLTDVDVPEGMAPWFSYVREIVRIDQERFIAVVDSGLFENVQTIFNGLHGAFKGKGYFTELNPIPLHAGNIPPRFGGGANIQQMVTVKKDYGQGNLQLTASLVTVDGHSVHLLDCDMDENRNIILHSLDLVKHRLNGGTSPVSMYEYILEDSAQNSPGGIATVDLGYRLV